MYLTLKHWRYAVAAADHGNITLAAQTLGISQPSISAAISHLESHFGRALFVRHKGQGVTLSPFGRSLTLRARRLLADAGDLEALDETGISSGGTVTIGCFEDLAPYYLPALLKAFSEIRPGVSVTFREAGFDILGRWLHDGTIDLALDYDIGLEANIARLPLVELKPYAMLPAGHPLAVNDAVSLSALCAYPLILTRQPHSWQHILNLFHDRGLDPQVHSRTTSLELQRGLVATGCGVAIAYTRPVADRSYDGRQIACRPLSDDVASQRILLAYPADIPLTAAAMAFRDCANDWFKQQASQHP